MTYGDFTALQGLDLDARPGEILALLGPNGAGKSSTVRCIVGLQRPTAGSITIGDVDALAEPARARRLCGYVPELPRLHDALTARETLLLKGRLVSLDDGTIQRRSERMLAGFGIGDRIDEPMASFSKGMQQKVALCAALLPEPRFLCLDEPLSGLDVETTFTVKEILREFAERGGTVLYCSHMLDVVQTVAHRVAVLHKGALLACGAVDELRQQAGSRSDADLGSVYRLLTQAADPSAAAKAILGG